MITVKEEVCSVDSQIRRLRIYLGTFPLSIHRSYSVVMDIKLCRQRAQEGHCRKERANFWSWQAGFGFYFAAQAEPVVPVGQSVMESGSAQGPVLQLGLVACLAPGQTVTISVGCVPERRFLLAPQLDRMGGRPIKFLLHPLVCSLHASKRFLA